LVDNDLGEIDKRVNPFGNQQLEELEKDFQFGDHNKRMDCKVDDNDFKTVKNLDVVNLIRAN